MFDTRTTCRSCGAGDLELVISFGDLPLADALADDEALRAGEARYPLTVVWCRSCYLMQILETVSPEVLFGRNYPYYSSFSDALLRHARANALRLIERCGLGPASLVVEVASNDGYLLQNFRERGIPVLGVDPAEGPASEARKRGIPTLCGFFGKDLASELRQNGVRADVVIANNVLAHVADLNGFVAGIGDLLKDDGVAVIEVPYVKNLIERCAFDTIYHEHLCYFSVSSLSFLFQRHGLTLKEVEPLPIHGGSLRLHVTHRAEPGDSVRHYLEMEAASGLANIDYYRQFGQRAGVLRDELRALLYDLKAKGRSIAAYGAAAKGATLLNFAGIDNTVIDFVVDRNIHKVGLFMPGVEIPIREPEALRAELPDHVLILTWNFAGEIVRQQEWYVRAGGKFVLPIPRPMVLDDVAEVQGADYAVA